MVETKKRPLTEKLHTRNPEPVTIVLNNQTGNSAVVIVNPYEGFVADIEFRVRRSNLAGTFELRDNDGNMLDDIAIVANGNGILKTFIQQSEKAILLAVVPSVSANYDLTVNILRHRITGVV